MVIFEKLQINSHPERWRDRPDETSATTNKRMVPNPAEVNCFGVLGDEGNHDDEPL